MPEGQFARHVAILDCCYSIGINECFDNWGYHVYTDTSRHLQVSIVRSSINQLIFHNRGFFTQESPIKSCLLPETRLLFPIHSLYDIEAIKDALLSDGIVPEDRWTDKKACLLAIYDFSIECWTLDPSLKGAAPAHLKDSAMLISPMRRAKAARLTFDCKYSFEWVEWSTDKQESVDIEMSHVTIKNDSWTR